MLRIPAAELPLASERERVKVLKQRILDTDKFDKAFLVRPAAADLILVIPNPTEPCVVKLLPTHSFCCNHSLLASGSRWLHHACCCSQLQTLLSFCAAFVPVLLSCRGVPTPCCSSAHHVQHQRARSGGRQAAQLQLQRVQVWWGARHCPQRLHSYRGR